MKMKNLIIAASVFSGAILASQSAFAQLNFQMNDLYLGFQNSGGGGTADYIINLGPATNILGKASVVDLSGDFSLSLFNNSALQGTSPQIYGGVVGGDNNISDVFGTTLRTSNIGNPSVAGSLAPMGLTKYSIDNTIVSTIGQIFAPDAGTGILDSTTSWEAYIEPTLTAQTYYGNAFNPDSQVSTSSVLYEDLYETIDSGDVRGGQGQPWVYLGYFTLDLTGGSPKLTFTSTNVAPSLTNPVIFSVGKNGSTVTVISRNAVSSFNYQLQYTARLNPTNWISVGSSVVASGPMVTNTDSTATDSKRFYRVQAH
jgi:hypothetical protein